MSRGVGTLVDDPCWTTKASGNWKFFPSPKFTISFPFSLLIIIILRLLAFLPSPSYWPHCVQLKPLFSRLPHLLSLFISPTYCRSLGATTMYNCKHLGRSNIRQCHLQQGRRWAWSSARPGQAEPWPESAPGWHDSPAVPLSKERSSPRL